jgi:hypothetical protein
MVCAFPLVTVRCMSSTYAIKLLTLRFQCSDFDCDSLTVNNIHLQARSAIEQTYLQQTFM